MIITTETENGTEIININKDIFFNIYMIDDEPIIKYKDKDNKIAFNYKDIKERNIEFNKILESLKDKIL